MRTAIVVLVAVAGCLGHAALAFAQSCTINGFFVLPGTALALSRRVYDAAVLYQDFAVAIVAARDAWNVLPSTRGRLGDWDGNVPLEDPDGSDECPSGQAIYRISALNFLAESCNTINTYHTQVYPLADVKRNFIALVDYFSPETLSQFNIQCQHCGTKSMVLNLSYTFSLDPRPDQDPKEYDIQSIMAHEFGHMLGLAHIRQAGGCGDEPANPPPARCSVNPNRNTMSSVILDGDTCQRDLTDADKALANSVYPPSPFAAGDFDSDLRADILWRNTSSGAVAVWLMNGAAVAGTGSPGTAPLVWQIAGVGDFNGNRRADILWRNINTGEVLIWLIEGASVANLAGSGSPGSVAAVWQIAGVGDFNGDGKADILWRNTSSGDVAIWLMDGFTLVGSGAPGNASLDWQIAGVGDFNGDGRADILWRQTSGTMAIWFMNGLSIANTGVPGSAGSDWTIAGVGDFSGDGRADILWRHTSGTVAIWLMNGLSIVNSGVPGSAPLDWQIEGTSDFNGDGRADILWRQTSGAVAMWFMNGLNMIGSGSPGSLGTDWQIQ